MIDPFFLGSIQSSKYESFMSCFCYIQYSNYDPFSTPKSVTLHWYSHWFFPLYNKFPDEYHYDVVQFRGWFNTGPWCNALSQLSMSGIVRSTCTLQVTQYPKLWIFTILKSYFHHKNVSQSFVLSSQKWICLPRLPSYLSFKTLSFPCFSMAVDHCYNG